MICGVRVRLIVLVALLVMRPVVMGAEQARPGTPRIVFETSAGTFTIATYPADAPLTVAHIVKLAKEGFYNGLRVHRAIPRFVVQFGDPQTRDESKRALWGRGEQASSGSPIGAAEILQKRKHGVGAVGVAHLDQPAKADSQIYITLEARPDLDGQYAVFGQVVDGLDVPGRLQVGDRIVRAVVEEQEGAGPSNQPRPVRLLNE